MNLVTLGQTTSSDVESSVRSSLYTEALSGSKSQTTSWNYVAAATATAVGIEVRSILTAISGLTWMMSQMEAWVDDSLKSEDSVTDLSKKALSDLDWKVILGTGLLLTSIGRIIYKGKLLEWRWV